MRYFVVSLLALAVTAFALPGRSNAEGFLDVYGGGSFHEQSNVTGTIFGLGTGTFPVAWENGGNFGVRGGYWFTGPVKWLGVGGELGWFNAPVPGDTVDLHVIPITPMVLVRIPIMPNEDHPGGVIQPFAGIGPGLFTSVVVESVTNNAAAGFAVGLDVKVGVAAMVARHLGLFAAYRYTQFDGTVTDTLGILSASTTLKTSHINVGVALRF